MPFVPAFVPSAFCMSNQAPASVPPHFAAGFAELNGEIALLASACADAIDKSVQHFSRDAWAVGTLPLCGPLADKAEARAKSLIVNPQSTGPVVEEVAGLLKNAEYLRTAARAARQNVQMAWLLKSHDADYAAAFFPFIHAIGEAASLVAHETALSLKAGERDRPIAARKAALLYHRVEFARAAAQNQFRLCAPEDASAHRMTRAALWYMVIAGESMARVAARTASSFPAANAPKSVI